MSEIRAELEPGGWYWMRTEGGPTQDDVRNGEMHQAYGNLVEEGFSLEPACPPGCPDLDAEFGCQRDHGPDEYYELVSPEPEIDADGRRVYVYRFVGLVEGVPGRGLDLLEEPAVGEAALVIHSTSLSIATISDRLGLQPTWSLPRTPPLADFVSWTYRLKVSDEHGATVEQSLERLLDTLLPRADAIDALARDPATDVRVTWWTESGDGEGGFELPGALIRRLAVLGCDASATVYFSAPGSVNTAEQPESLSRERRPEIEAAQLAFRDQIAMAWLDVGTDCGCVDLWFCPRSGDIECPRHSGFSVCCDRYEDHVPVRGTEPRTV